jgi:hypothetical protein
MDLFYIVCFKMHMFTVKKSYQLLRTKMSNFSHLKEIGELKPLIEKPHFRYLTSYRSISFHLYRVLPGR